MMLVWSTVTGHLSQNWAAFREWRLQSPPEKPVWPWGPRPPWWEGRFLQAKESEISGDPSKRGRDWIYDWTVAEQPARPLPPVPPVTTSPGGQVRVLSGQVRVLSGTVQEAKNNFRTRLIPDSFPPFCSCLRHGATQRTPSHGEPWPAGPLLPPRPPLQSSPPPACIWVSATCKCLDPWPLFPWLGFLFSAHI